VEDDSPSEGGQDDFGQDLAGALGDLDPPQADAGSDADLGGLDFLDSPQPPARYVPPPPPGAQPGETFMIPQGGLTESPDGEQFYGEHDLGALEAEDGDRLSVDGTEFTDVDNLLDELDEE
jgi:hypothetical protein